MITNLEWLEKNAKQVPSDLPEIDYMVWVTKERGDYICPVGAEDMLPLERFGITDNVQSTWEKGSPINLGFNPEEQKWYGWSHRAVYGFAIGSECKRGDCHYMPIDPDDFLKDMVRFWSGDNKINVAAEHQAEDGSSEPNGVYISWEYDNKTPNEKIQGTISGVFQHYPDHWGKGEWRAETLEDAKQMAIDFAESVS